MSRASNAPNAPFSDIIERRKQWPRDWRGDGDAAETRVEQIRVDAGIAVNQDLFGGKTLGAVTGCGVAEVKVRNSLRLVRRSFPIDFVTETVTFVADRNSFSDE